MWRMATAKSYGRLTSMISPFKALVIREIEVGNNRRIAEGCSKVRGEPVKIEAKGAATVKVRLIQ
jgi:hypothetical protein